MDPIKTLTLAAALLGGLTLQAADSKPSAAAAPKFPPVQPAAMQNWQDKRFGMFIHWGPVSLTAKEIGWSRGAQTPIEVYDNLYRRFNPTNFNADAWVKVAKDAGMKYIVLTTKHHDGFCLWDTKLTDYNIMNGPFKRDVVKELSAACKRGGVAFGTYYSTCDWHHPDFPLTSPGGKVKRPQFDLDAYNRYLLGQMSELVTNYGPLITMWNDVPQMFQGRGVNSIKLLRQLQPDITINNRTGDGGDYDTPEQRVGKFQNDRPWESCMTLSAHNHWAYGGPADGVKSLAACLEMLIRGAGGDGNILLNVGPTPLGETPPDQVSRLQEMGAWLAKNGDSIYGTRGGPWKPSPAIASTRKGSFIYVHVLRPAEGRIELPALPRKVKAATLLGGGAVPFSQEGDKLRLTLDKGALDPIDTIVRLEMDGSAMDLPVVALVAESNVKASASNVFQKQTARLGAQAAFDRDPETRWATDSGTKQAWIVADLGKPMTIQRVRISEAVQERVQAFEFQYRDGESWKTIFTGQKLGPAFQRLFDPVTASAFRLNILNATDGPTISEIELLEK
jgi:alpha-L-fucosidase